MPVQTGKINISTTLWSDINKSKLPKSSFLWIEGNGKKKNQWYLPYKDEQGRINLNALEAIAAAINGVRTGKPMNLPIDVKKKINKLLKQHNIGKENKLDQIDINTVREAEINLWCLTLVKNFNND